jgi:transaldolase
MSEDNRLKKITTVGQSIWCDNVERRMITDGTFKRLIEQDGLAGVTSNPTIFEKAINNSKDYDAQLRELGGKGLSPEEIYWTLVIKDIQDVADIFDPVFFETDGEDGYISIEVNPLLAHDTEKTIAQGKELWKRVDRRNIMVKVPATAEGIPAIEALIAEGLNINVTLIFSVERYKEVINAYLTGLEKRLEAKKTLTEVASVASFFVSRVDTETDKRIEEKIAQDTASKDALEPLLGKTGIANSKLAYHIFEEIFKSERFEKLRKVGANVQRPLWASTSTKNPKYKDILYVEELMGPQTVNTVPPATLEAFRDHGEVTQNIGKDFEQAQAHLDALQKAGFDLEEITAVLEKNGVSSFSDSFKKLIESIKAKEIKVGVNPE